MIKLVMFHHYLLFKILKAAIRLAVVLHSSNTWYLKQVHSGTISSNRTTMSSNRTTMSSNRTTMRNKEQGSYCFTIKIEWQTNSCLALYFLVVLFEAIAHSGKFHSIRKSFQVMRILFRAMFRYLLSQCLRIHYVESIMLIKILSFELRVIYILLMLSSVSECMLPHLVHK